MTKIILIFFLLVTVAMGYSTVAMADSKSEKQLITEMVQEIEDLGATPIKKGFENRKKYISALKEQLAEEKRIAAEANSMIYYFNSSDGRPVTSHEISGEALVKQGLAIKKVDVPTDVESWRLSLDLNTNAVVVFAEGKDEEGALAQKKTEDEAEALAGKEKSKADEKAEADRQAANDAESARNATRQAAEAERKTAYANSEAGREEQSVRDAESARNATRQAAEAERKTAYANSEAGREEQSVRDAESARNATRQAAEADRKTAYANSEAGREEQSVRDAESARIDKMNATVEANTAEANSESNTAEANSESNTAEAEAASIAEEK